MAWCLVKPRDKFIFLTLPKKDEINKEVGIVSNEELCASPLKFLG
jgi:hypothetical protein